MDVREPTDEPNDVGLVRTDIGVLPEDWPVCALGNLAKIHDGTHQTPNYVSSGVPFFSVEQVTSNDFDSTKFISEAEYSRISRSSRIERGDVLMTRIGSIGECKLIDWEVRAGYYVSLALLKFHDPTLAGFFAQFSGTAAFKREVELHSLAHAIPKKINLGPIAFLQVPVPPGHEQVEVTRVLADADALIESLEQLLAKKRQIKQGAMQELLTGQRRLPGFDGEWVLTRLDQLAVIQRGASPRPIDDPIWFDSNSEVGWVRISDLTRSGMYLRETTQRLSELGVRHSRPVARGSLIMSICATVGRPAITDIDACIHDGFVVFDAPSVDKHFLFYVLTAIEPLWAQHGQTGSQMNLNTPLINRTTVLLPPSAEEQRAVADALMEFDADIDQTETKLTKARHLKQAMMQALLTGRIRLAPQRATG